MFRQTCHVLGPLLGLLTASIASAATISVGPSGCNTTSLQAAINNLSGSADTSYTIKLKAGTIAIPSGVSMSVPASDIDIIGGFASCNDASPTAGLRSTLDASGGGDGTTMTIDAGNRSLQQWITFTNATIRGGSSETGPFSNPEGGGLEVRGHARVWLRDDTRVEDNASGKGAGVYLNGASSTRPAELYILDGSSISNNVAITLGGGVYCNNFGAIQFYDGRISFNDANDGGGVYLNPGCKLVGIGTGSGNLKSIDNNRALVAGSSGGSGGAIYLKADSAIANPIHLVGDPGNPILMLNNSASSGGGGIYAGNNSTALITLDLINTIWLGQRATAGAGLLLSGRFDTRIEAQPGCSYSFFGASGCSAFDDNDASNGAGAILFYGGDTEALAGQLTIKRTRFENNDGAPAIVGTFRAELTMEGAIVRNNRSLPYGYLPYEHTLFGLDSGTPHSIRYSTILANDTFYIFSYGFLSSGSTLNLVGDIVWAPGTQVWRNFDGSGPATVQHFGCLIAHSATGLPSGVIVANPMLESNFTPGVTSPALDVCNDSIGGAPSQDYYGQARGFDQVAIVNVLGPNDLGAVERRTAIDDTIFRDGFENP